MAQLQANGANLYYEVHGVGPETIVFAHGKGGNHLSWWHQVAHFSERFRCITFDHRSYGLSTNSSDGRNQEAYVDDLTAILDQVGVSSANLVGQSMGGRTCLDFTIAYPERVKGLVLASTIAGVVDPDLQEILKLHANAPKDLLPRVLSRGFREKNAALTQLFASIEALNHVGKDPFPLLIKGANRDAVAKCNTRTLLVVGDEDLVAPPQAVGWLANKLPNAELKIIANTGHSIYFERPSIFNEALDQFFITQ
jgi:pimeloyl-ACP methyl ester carboxylesterase